MGYCVFTRTCIHWLNVKPGLANQPTWLLSATSSKPVHPFVTDQNFMSSSTQSHLVILGQFLRLSPSFILQPLIDLTIVSLTCLNDLHSAGSNPTVSLTSPCLAIRVKPYFVFQFCPVLSPLSSAMSHYHISHNFPMMYVLWFLGRLFRVYLIKLVSHVCPSVRTYVRPQKRFFWLQWHLACR